MAPSYTLTRTFAALALAFACAASAQPTPPGVSLSGSVPKPTVFAMADLEALGPVKAPWKEHDAAHEVEGVPLGKLLAQAGFAPGQMGKVPKREKRAGWKMVLRATAADGFQAIFSCAELWDGMGPTRALLVWKIDGKPLPAKAGPFRIVVLTDREPSRSVFQVAKLEVLDLRN
jgi:DMSO/TMAO reductase YedYZ molybdopterin-dependent catalytic subunit